MAFIEIAEAPEHLTLEEVRQEMVIAADALNKKREIHRTPGYAPVRVGEVLIHPVTKVRSITIIFSNRDGKAPKYVRSAWNQLEKRSDLRRRLLRVDRGWFTFVRFDPCMA